MRAVWWMTALVIWGTVAAGCNKGQAAERGPDLSGWYEVTHHTRSASDCVTEGEDATGLPWIRLTWEEHNTSDYLALRRCTDFLEVACDNEDFFHGTSFVVPVENGWEELKASAAPQPATGECYLTYGLARLLHNGAGVILELRRYETFEPGVPAAECTYERAMDAAESMPCAEYEVIHGQPPAD